MEDIRRVHAGDLEPIESRFSSIITGALEPIESSSSSRDGRLERRLHSP